MVAMEIVIALVCSLVVAGAVVAGVLVLLRRQAEAQRAEWDRRAEAERVERARRAEAELAAVARQAGAVAGEQVRTSLQAGMQAGTQELDVRRSAIDEQVAAMTERLEKVNDLVGALQRDRAAQHGELLSRLTEATEVTRRLDDATGALRQALASPKARGQWGERMAEDVLRLAGLKEGVSYRKQTATPAGTIPDFTFFVDEGRHLHMDVKFPVDNYLRYLEAEADGEREQLRKQFLKDVRARVKELAGRDYADAETTVGFLLLFIPNEAVYSFIHEHDPDLVEVALSANVVPCSPSTLFGVLALVRQAHDNLVLERTSDEILQCLAGFTTQWDKFNGQLDKLGRALGSTQTAFDELSGTRRRALQRQIDRVEDLRRHRGLVDAEADGVPLTEVTPEGELRPFRLEAG